MHSYIKKKTNNVVLPTNNEQQQSNHKILMTSSLDIGITVVDDTICYLWPV